MSIEIGSYDYQVIAHDIDFTGQATYVALLDYLLKAAGDDADVNGFGVSDLNHGNCSWVLSRMAVQFERRLTQFEKFRVVTWVNEINKLTTIRNMRIYDENDEEVAAAVTQWAVIDLDRRSAIDIREQIDYKGSVMDIESPIERPRRIGKVEPTISVDHKVVYSDIDFNKHTNSTKYIEWMFDMLPLDYLAQGLLTRIDINFLHEALYGDTLSIGLEQKRGLFEVVKEDGLPVCRVALEWCSNRTIL